MNQQSNPTDSHSINSSTIDIGGGKPIDTDQSNNPLNQVSQVESSANVNRSSSEDEIDFNEFASFNPHAPLALEAQYQLAQDEENPLPVPVSERGIPRMVVMLLLTGGVILLGLVIWEFIKPKSAIRPIAQTTSKETKEPLIEDEKPELLAKLAYVDQQNLVAQNPKTEQQSQTKSTPKSTLPSVRERSTPRQATAPSPTLPPRTLVRTVTIPALTPNSVPVSTSEPTKPITHPAPTIEDEQVDPFERWNQLAQLGQSRGNLEIDPQNGFQNASISTAKEQASDILLIGNREIPVDNHQPSDIAEASTLSDTLPTASDRSSEFVTVSISNSSQNRQAAQTNPSPGTIGILTRTPQSPKPTEMVQVALGTTVSGTVSVPLLWDEDNREQLYKRFAITLTEDLLATDGSVGLKAGTVIVAKANHVGKENQMVQASGIGIVYTDESGQVKQQEIPSGAILITGENGAPLIAKGYLDPGNDIANQDIFIALLSGVGRVGEVLTQPRVRSRSSINSRGFSSDTITMESQTPQIWSAVLNGFFTPLAKRIEQRSNQATEELLNRPNIATVPKGTKISLVLNSFLHINR